LGDINTLRNSSSNATDKANALSSYLTTLTNSNISSTSNNTLSVGEINGIFGNLTNQNYKIANNNSVIILTQPGGNLTNKTIIGAAFQSANGGLIVQNLNKVNVTNSIVTVAGIVALESLSHTLSFNMLLVNDPTSFQNVDNSSERVLVSSMVFATMNRNLTDNLTMKIQLYFQVLKPPQQTGNNIYMCAFYDTNSLQWNSSGCGTPSYNSIFNRYECSCNHLTSFALIWLPQSTINGPVVLDAQDQASIAFQLISIACFLGIVIHGFVIRIINPKESTESKNLLPLISCGITMILFVFYIALGLTVYSRYSQVNPSIQNSSNQQGLKELNPIAGRRRRDLTSQTGSSSDACLPNEHALMYIVYFFIIFMFCSKTSVGYYNYNYFVELFPPPPLKRLFIAISLSALIGVIWMAFAAGFDSNPSNAITHIVEGKLCWFTVSVIHYFLTIPIVIFLVVNLILFILVAKHIISHAEIAQTDYEKYKRRKKCVIVLLSSCVTQGLGWIFGPLILIANPTGAEALAWLFVIFNGLEGVWAILLYLIVRKEKMDRNLRDRNDDYLPQENIEMHQPQDQIDDERHEIRTQKLKSLRSDSPRNSFTDIAAAKPHRRSHLGDNDDR
jgi:hypothetical protein